MADERPIATCASCAAPLVCDQRYCVACGTRRGPLPAALRAQLAGFAGLLAPRARETAPRPAAPPSRLVGPVSLPSPRAIGVAVLAMLAAGTAVGAEVGGTADAGTAPVVVAVAPPAAAPDAAPADAGASLPETSTTRVITVTDAASPPSAPATATAPDAAQDAPAAAPAPTTAPTGPVLPPIKHVWLIVLSGSPGADQTFSTSSPAPYLGTTLAKDGELIPNYYAVTHGGLANEIALLSGQGPTMATAADCPTYTPVTPASPADDGQVVGDGCAYPKSVESLPDQLEAAGFTSRFYVQGLPAPDPSLPPGTCARPASGAPDPLHDVRADGAYVTWRNPAPYFAALVDSPTCTTSVVSTDQLAADLQDATSTPAFSYISPDRCHDGSAQDRCPDGAPTGLAGADAWLRSVVPQITASPAYEDGGLIAITFDEAPADSTSCCGQPTFPNAPAGAPSSPAPASTDAPATTDAPASTDTPASTATPSATTPPDGSAPGGGRVGLLLLSPYVKAGSVNGFGVFDHFSLLRSFEDLFSVEHLGYAADPAVPAFDQVVYDAAPADG